MYIFVTETSCGGRSSHGGSHLGESSHNMIGAGRSHNRCSIRKGIRVKSSGNGSMVLVGVVIARVPLVQEREL